MRYVEVAGLSNRISYRMGSITSVILSTTRMVKIREPTTRQDQISRLSTRQTEKLTFRMIHHVPLCIQRNRKQYNPQEAEKHDEAWLSCYKFRKIWTRRQPTESNGPNQQKQSRLYCPTRIGSGMNAFSHRKLWKKVRKISIRFDLPENRWRRKEWKEWSRPLTKSIVQLAQLNPA